MKPIYDDTVTIYKPAQDDADLMKWRAVQGHLASPSLPFVRPDQWLSIAMMNSAINRQIHYVSDLEDHWQTPDETSALGTGDCEDFAIYKMAALKQNGFDYGNMCLMLGEIAALSGNQPHAYVIVELNGEQRVLDSKFDQLIKPSEYINWQARKMIISDELFLVLRPLSIADRIAPPIQQT